MKQYAIKRKSHCDVCGARLSERKRPGDIHWKPCHINDKGIYCVTCYMPKTRDKAGKNVHR